VDVRRLAKDFAAEPEKLADAIKLLVEQGFAKRVYRLEDPGGHLLDEEFQSPFELPERISDRFDKHFFDTEDCELVSGFKLRSTRSGT
jgi:hypothetical protein